MKKVWQTAAAVTLAVLYGGILAPTAAAVELDLNGIYEHPVRVAVGVVCLVAAVVLLLYRVLRHPMENVRRTRSYGEDKTAQGASMESYRRSRRKRKERSGGVFGLLLPNYKGRKQTRSGPQVSVAVPERHRASRRRGSTALIRGFSNRPYKGGGSVAGSANLRTSQPDSYKAPWGGSARYGRLHLQKSGKRYQGGGSAAGSADLCTSQPDSYRQPWGWKGRYGGFTLPVLPIPYFGRRKGPDGAVPGPHTPARHTGKSLFRPAPAKVTYAEPERYRNWFGLRRRYGMKNSPDEIPIYHGSNHVLRAARVALAAPLSYREPWGSKRRYGTQSVMALPPAYRGSVFLTRNRRNAPALPLSYREPWGSKARYGTQSIMALPPAYRGSVFVTKSRRIAPTLPLSYREPWGSKARYGTQPVMALPPAYRGSIFVTRSKRIAPALPLSYREPWGWKGRYGQEPKGYEPPLSYREPWGLLRRYGAGDPLERTALPLPTPYLGGSTTTAKEPWIDPDTGRLAEPVQRSAKQYGNRRYGGKLYGGRIVRYREEEPLDSSTVVHDDEDSLQTAAQSGATDT